MADTSTEAAPTVQSVSDFEVRYPPKGFAIIPRGIVAVEAIMANPVRLTLWLHCYLGASFRDNATRIQQDGHRTALSRGQLHISQPELARRTGWTTKQVRAGLAWLVKGGYLGTQMGRYGVLITIRDYDRIDNMPRTEGRQVGRPRANGGQAANANHLDSNGNPEPNSSYSSNSTDNKYKEEEKETARSEDHGICFSQEHMSSRELVESLARNFGKARVSREVAAYPEHFGGLLRTYSRQHVATAVGFLNSRPPDKTAKIGGYLARILLGIAELGVDPTESPKTLGKDIFRTLHNNER